jgi:hypothetical protein
MTRITSVFNRYIVKVQVFDKVISWYDFAFLSLIEKPPLLKIYLYFTWGSKISISPAEDTPKFNVGMALDPKNAWIFSNKLIGRGILLSRWSDLGRCRPLFLSNGCLATIAARLIGRFFYHFGGVTFC